MLDQCNMSLAPIDADFLDRAHRFLRLWAATGYKMWELDLLLLAPAVGNGTLDANALAALLPFQQLLDATKLAVDQLLVFYQDIDTATHRDPDGTTTTSLYTQMFLNPTITSVAPDPDMAAVVTGGTIADPVLSDHIAGDTACARRERGRRGDALRPHRRPAQPGQPQLHLPRQPAGHRRRSCPSPTSSPSPNYSTRRPRAPATQCSRCSPRQPPPSSSSPRQRRSRPPG